MSVALLTLMIMTGIALILLVYIQSGEVKATGSAITGSQDLELFENKKVRESKKALNIATWNCVVLFITFAIILATT